MMQADLSEEMEQELEDELHRAQGRLKQLSEATAQMRGAQPSADGARALIESDLAANNQKISDLQRQLAQPELSPESATQLAEQLQRAQQQSAEQRQVLEALRGEDASVVHLPGHRATTFM